MACLIGGFLLQNFGLSNIGSSFTGGMFALAFQGGLLSDDGLNDDTTFADDMVLSNSPLYLDAEGTPTIVRHGEKPVSLTINKKGKEIKVHCEYLQVFIILH